MEFPVRVDSHSHHRGYQLNVDGISSARWMVGGVCGVEIEVEEGEEVMGYVGTHSGREVQVRIVR